MIRWVFWTACLLVLCFLRLARWGPGPTSSPGSGPTSMPDASVTVAPFPGPTGSLPTPTALPVSPARTATSSSVFAGPTASWVDTVDVPARDPLALAVRLKGSPSPISPVVSAAPPDLRLGDQEVFWVGNNDTSEQFRITATLRAITPHLHMWVEDGRPVDQQALEKSARRFEEQIYPTNRAYFGSEWTPGVDGDVHLTVLNAHGLGQGVLGYFSSADEYPRVANPYSNEREMFYTSLEYLRPGSEAYDSTLAHEFQHMIQWANDRNEDVWVSEGFSTLAQHLNGDRSASDLQSYPSAPDTQLTAWGLTDQPTAPHYEASFLFSLYFLERFGEPALHQVATEPLNGAHGFEAALTGQGLSFDGLFADWVVANYAGDYQGIDLPPFEPAADHSTYPVSATATVHQYGVDYIRLRHRSDVQVAFQGISQVKAVPNAPHSGRTQWWSNYGDESDMTLTRAFDLSGLARATLEAWLWYDIEEGWDYGYVEVSTDGQRWHPLFGRHTTDYNPNGNAFGVGYTGRSGGGDRAVWVQERIDLTPYSGRKVLLRFEYITDDAVNHPGLCVDDIAIPELGYTDDAEADTAWKAEGFVRMDNQLAQRFLVQVIEPAALPQVRSMSLDASNRGQAVIRGSGQAILAISGLTPVTQELATYTYTVEALPGGG